MHGFQAYQAAQYNVMDRQRDVFPYWQYLTMGDDHVRPEHAALNGVVLPADHPFWRDHYPPWDYGCRCQVVPLSEDDVDDVRADDAGKPPEARDLIEGAQLEKLEQNGTLFRSLDGGAAQNFDVRSPLAKASTPEERQRAFRWHPGDLRLDLEQLKARYDAPVWEAFETWARKQSLGDGKTTVWEWLNGAKPPRMVNGGSKAEGAGESRADSSFGIAMLHTGLDKKPGLGVGDARRVLSDMKAADPLKASEVISEVSGADTRGILSPASVRKMVQRVTDFVPAGMQQRLRAFRIEIVDAIEGKAEVQGDYKNGTLRLARGWLEKLDPKERPAAVLRTVFHETGHWLHAETRGVSAEEWRDALKRHFAERTKGDKPYPDGEGGWIWPDKWWRPYAGRQYKNKPADGEELVPVYFELLANPKLLASKIGSPATADTLKLVTRILSL